MSQTCFISQQPRLKHANNNRRTKITEHQPASLGYRFPQGKALGNLRHHSWVHAAGNEVIMLNKAHVLRCVLIDETFTRNVF